MRILIGDPIRFDDILRKFDEERAHDPRMCENSAAIAPLLILSVFEFGCSDCSGLNRDHLLYSTLTARVHLALRSLDAELTRRIERELRDCQRLAERCAADAESAGNVEAANRSNRSSSSAQTEGEEEPSLWFRLSHALGLTNRHLRGLRALLQSKAQVQSRLRRMCTPTALCIPRTAQRLQRLRDRILQQPRLRRLPSAKRSNASLLSSRGQCVRMIRVPCFWSRPKPRSICIAAFPCARDRDNCLRDCWEHRRRCVH